MYNYCIKYRFKAKARINALEESLLC